MAKKDATVAIAGSVATVNPSAAPALFETEMPDFLKGQNTERGSENVRTEDLVIPRIEIVQALSPVKDESEAGYIPGAKEADLYNVVTRTLYGKAVLVIPIFFRKEFLVWKRRIKGQPLNSTDQFQGSYQSMEEAEAKIATMENPDGWEIIDTPQHFCLLLKSDGTTEEAVISMARTKAKVSRKWNSLIRIAGGDRFSRVYELGGVKEENAFGKFYNYHVQMAGFPSLQAYKKAEKLYNQIATGAIQVHADHSVEGDASGDSEEY